jgi:hypothetical protein
MIIDVRADLLRRQLAEAQELLAFWLRQRELRPGEYSYTLGSLQQQIDELQAQLKKQ